MPSRRRSTPPHGRHSRSASLAGPARVAPAGVNSVSPPLGGRRRASRERSGSEAGVFPLPLLGEFEYNHRRQQPQQKQQHNRRMSGVPDPAEAIAAAGAALAAATGALEGGSDGTGSGGGATASNGTGTRSSRSGGRPDMVGGSAAMLAASASEVLLAGAPDASAVAAATGPPASARGRPPSRGRLGAPSPMLDRSVSAWAAKSDANVDDREANTVSGGGGDTGIECRDDGRGGDGRGGGGGGDGRGGGDGGRGGGGGRGLATPRAQSQRRPRGDRDRSPPEVAVMVVGGRDSGGRGGGAGGADFSAGADSLGRGRRTESPRKQPLAWDIKLASPRDGAGRGGGDSARRHSLSVEPSEERRALAMGLAGTGGGRGGGGGRSRLPWCGEGDLRERSTTYSRQRSLSYRCVFFLA